MAFLVIVPFTRVAPRLAIASGLLTQAVAGFAMAQLDINLTSFHVFWMNVMMGFGQSIAFTPMAVLAFATLPARQITEGTAVFTMVRNFGSSLFISLSVLMLVRSTAANYARMTEFISPYNPTLVYPGLPNSWSLDSISGLLRLSNEIQRQSAMIGYVNAFYMMAVVAIAAVPLAFLMNGAPKRV